MPRTCDPRFFLASVDENVWAPIVLVISQAGSTVGIVYAKERKLAGFPMGIIYADATLGAMVVAEPGHRKAVLETALNLLLDRPRTRGLRILVSPEGLEHKVIQAILDSRLLDIHHTAAQNHCVLELEPSYEAFLSKLSKKTRRNFRYYRQRFEALGTYVDEVPPAEFERVAYSLLEKSVVGAERTGIERSLKMFAATEHSIRVGLRHHNGEWLAILGGWYELDRAVVFFQMNNDRDYAQNALSVVLRGYLIESLIARNIPNLLFWAGVGSPLLRYCWFLPAICIYLDVPTFVWRNSRRFIGWTTGFLPARMRLFGSWVSGDVQLPARRSFEFPRKLLDTRWIRSWATRAEGRWFDARRRVQTSGFVPLQGLTLTGDGKSGFDYLPTRPSVARDVLENLPIQDYSEYTFVDLGSGKGRMLLLAAQYPFRGIQGVEFALELHLQGEKNISGDRLSAERRCTDVRSINVDATEYLFPTGKLVVYLFNPFGPEIFAKVLANLATSFARQPRHVILVILNPEFGGPGVQMPVLRLHSETRRYQIYQSDMI